MGIAKLSPTAEARNSLTHQTQQLRRNLQTPIPAARVTLERKISLKFPHFRGFLTETSSNISITGMFIQSKEPQAIGTLVDFEFSLIDGLELIRGRGEVAWARRQDTDPNQPPGMGIRFLRLDAESRRLIRWAVEKQIADGGQPFDLDSQPPARPLRYSPSSDSVSEDPPSEAAGSLADDRALLEMARKAIGRSTTSGAKPNSSSSNFDSRKVYPYAGYAMVRDSKWRQWLAAAAVAAVSIGILLTAGNVSLSGSDSTTFAAPAATPTATAEAPTATAEAPTAMAEAPSWVATAPMATGPSVPGRDQQQAAPDDEALNGILDMTEKWAAAWAEQRPIDYVRFYSLRYTPPHAMSRDAWEAQRAQRLTRPDFIQVGISNLESELLAPDRGRVSFDQSYRSDNFRDRTRKTLEVVLEDNEWKILGEHVVG